MVGYFYLVNRRKYGSGSTDPTEPAAPPASFAIHLKAVDPPLFRVDVDDSNLRKRPSSYGNRVEDQPEVCPRPVERSALSGSMSTRGRAF